MESNAKSMLAFACQAMLRPIVKILMRCGMTFKEFEAHAKTVFVDVCATDYGIRGRPANASRIAIMTGLSRREIQRQKTLPLGTATDAVRGVDRASRVLAGWHDDPQFCEKAGVPKPLSEDGPQPSFADLFARYGGDVPMTAMFKELIRSGAVEQTKDGRLLACHRYYMPVRTDAVVIERAATVFADIGATVYYNINREPKDPSRFEGRATNLAIPANAVPAFRQYLEKRGEDFLDTVDQWLGEHEQETDKDDAVRLGVGLYFIEN